jgi:hypothetical protein
VLNNAEEEVEWLKQKESPGLPAFHHRLQVQAVHDDLLILSMGTLEVVDGRGQPPPKGCKQGKTVKTDMRGPRSIRWIGRGSWG